MTDTRPDFETLNAYVDGELDAAAAAEVARAIARDRDIADQVALLSKLRSSLHDSAETPDFDLTPPLRRAAPTRSWLVAACVALLLIGGGLFADRAFKAAPDPGWLAPALDTHAAWSSPDNSASNAEIVSARFDAVFADAYIPDLSASKLTLVYGSESTLDNGRALVLGYTGTRGCKVTLMVSPTLGTDGERIMRFEDGTVTAFAWRAHELGYLIVAEGMDAERFRLIAETVHRTSLERRTIDDETRIALAESRAHSAPCVA